jgi:hypothetical protein
MNLTFILFFLIVGVILAVGAAVILRPTRRISLRVQSASLEQTGRRHATYLSLIQQALSPADLDFLTSHGSSAMAHRVRKERRLVALNYLHHLRTDFHQLLCLARVIASLSPAVDAGQEFERLRLNFQFLCRYQMVRLGLSLGLLVVPQLSGLSQIVSELAVRMDSAMKELGERAALAAKLASASDGRGVDIA